MVEAVQRVLSMSCCRSLPVGIGMGVFMPFSFSSAARAAAPLAQIAFRSARLS